MPTLNTGLIISGGYADKVRKTLFAQLRSALGSGVITSQQVAKAVAELNQTVYSLLVDKLKSERGDVVRIRIDYQLENGEIKWAWETLKIEFFKRKPDEEVNRIVQEVLAELKEAEPIKVEGYSLEKAASTALGDSVYKVKFEGKEIGVLLASPLGEETIVKGAVVEPTPTIIEGFKLSLQGQSLDEALNREAANILRSGRKTVYSEAEKAVKELEALIETES